MSLKDKVCFSIEPVSQAIEINPTISKARVRIFYTGLNRNLTYISEEFAEKLLKTLPYTPVGGIWVDEKEDFSDHGGRDPSDREKLFIYGVVPAEPNISWEEHLDEDSIMRRYACCDVYLWTARYEAARKIPGKSQSMEIYLNSIKGEWKREGPIEYFEYTDGCFFGLVALGDDVEPCFEGAAFYNINKEDKDFLGKVKEYLLFEKNKEKGGKEMEDTVLQNENNEVKDTMNTTEATVDEQDKSKDTTTLEAENKETDKTENEENEENTEELGTEEDKNTKETANSTEEKTTEEVVDKGTEENTEENNKTVENDNPISQEAFEQLQSNYEILLEENKQLKIQVEAYQNQINQIEEDKKKEFLNKYSSLLDEEEYNKYNNKIQEYSLEDLKKDISLELLEKNEDTLFSKRETKETVSKLPSQNLSGAARIMQEYFDK